MSTTEKCLAHLVAARLALLDAELYLANNDPQRATIHLDLAQAYTREVRGLLPGAPQLPRQAGDGDLPTRFSETALGGNF
jgi:hypothetical protein